MAWNSKETRGRLNHRRNRSVAVRRWPRLTREDYLKGIHHSIKRLRELWIAEFDFSDVSRINDGHCEYFAIILADGFSPSRVVWDDELFEKAGGDHCFMEYNGRYYDSETPHGVEHWSHFPMYLRNYHCHGYHFLRAFMPETERDDRYAAWSLITEAFNAQERGQYA